MENVLWGMAAGAGGLALAAGAIGVAALALRVYEYWLTLQEHANRVARSAMMALTATPTPNVAETVAARIAQAPAPAATAQGVDVLAKQGGVDVLAKYHALLQQAPTLSPWRPGP